MFNKGDTVKKRTGYAFDGVVVCRFYTLGGDVRYVVEHATSRGLLHIFNEDQLAKR